MHICFASLSYPLEDGTSGVGAQTQTLARGLTRGGETVSVVALSQNDQLEPINNQGVSVYLSRTTSLHWYLKKIPWFGSRLSLPLRELEYGLAVWLTLTRITQRNALDLIEGTETGGLFTSLFYRKIPFIIRLHGEQYTFYKHMPGSPVNVSIRLSRVFQRIALQRARVLISPTFMHAREIAKELGQKHPPIVIIPNSADCGNESQNLLAERDPKTVLFVGRVEPLKGVKVLLEAAKYVSLAIPDVKFVFAGRFNPAFSKQEFFALAQRFQVENNVITLGEINLSALYEHYKKATVAVLPSFYETFGIAALEEMCFGLPVVGTLNTGLAEVIEDNVSGFLVEKNKPHVLAEALIKLLEDPPLRTNFGEAAIKRAKKFNIQQLLPRNLQVYEWIKSDLVNEFGPHLFLSPHADDVVLSCGGIIHALTSSGKSVVVVNTFSGNQQNENYSAFARHLHAKWDLVDEPASSRRQEDIAALKKLGVDNPIYWEFLEAPYRYGPNNFPVHATYAEMRGRLTEADRELEKVLLIRLMQLLDEMPETTIVYVPLALGNHVDHQILRGLGLILQSQGRRMRFYEDYPYVKDYEVDASVFNWIPKTIPIQFNVKTEAALLYFSQINGLGGSPNAVTRRLEQTNRSTGKRKAAERVWEHVLHDAELENFPHARRPIPLRPKSNRPALRDARKFLDIFRWHDLDEMLPPGSGICLDVGSGRGRHANLIQKRGYQWLGVEHDKNKAKHLRSGAEELPIAAQSVAALVLWQVMEYLAEPEKAISEASRVLEPGGIFCGSVSFLEPLHGQTLYNLSPILLEKLLKKHGFDDIEIQAGLNGFSLMFWTWLRRTGVPLVEKLALPFIFMWLALPSLCLFFLSWFSFRLGLGNGHTMRWLTEKAPLEFAGHVLFSARKKARAA